MAEERTTSAAKDVQLSSYQQAALDRQEAIKSRYNESAQGRSAEQVNQGQAQGGNEPPGGPGSEQVKKQAQQPHLRPQGPERNAVDAQTHRQDMAKDEAAVERRQQLLERNQKAKDASNAQDGVHLNRDGNSRD